MDLTQYRRRLPHWRARGAIYFITWRLHDSQRELAADDRSLVLGALNHFDGARYHLFAAVVMNDHVHALFAPVGEHRVESILHSWKSFTANQLGKSGRRGRIWQEEYFDRVVRDDEELAQKAKYIAENPQKRWPNIAEYRWVQMR